MRLRFGLDLSGAEPPGDASAIGRACVGPAGLLRLLETALGLSAPATATATAARVAALLPRLRQTEGFWSASLDADPWGTATRLVSDRDALALQGWRGESVSPRLDALWQLTAGMAPAFGDRLAAVADAIPGHAHPLEAIELVDLRGDVPGAVARVLGALERSGVELVEVEQAAIASEVPGSDLAGARIGKLTARGDGSLQLVRAQGPAAAAEDIAAWLAERGDPATTTIIAPNATLDLALHHAGLPTTGAPALEQPAEMRVLPLALELLWEPPDPQRVLEWLALPHTPIPRGLARRWIAALRQTPAVDSRDWREAFAAHDFGEDLTRANDDKARVIALTEPAAPRESEAVDVAAVRARTERLTAWVRGVAFTREDDHARRTWHAALAQHEALLALLRQWPEPTISAATLARLVDAATTGARPGSPCAAEAGLRSVQAPGALLDPVDTVIWWSFTRQAASPVRAPRISVAERAALARAGVPIADPGREALALARRWRRPLAVARRRLLLVCPHLEGDRAHPHPLWDEIVAAVDEDHRKHAVAALTVVRPGLGEVPEATRTPAPSRPLPRATPRFSFLPGSLAPRDKDSPSGLGKLVACSLQWALRYPLKLRDGGIVHRLQVGPRELSSLAHEVLAEVIEARPASPDEAAADAGQRYDRLAPRRIAALFTAGHATERETTRLQVTRSAAAIVGWMLEHDLQPQAVESLLSTTVADQRIEGRVDLLAGPPRVVIDFKWGRREALRRELQTGTAFQLATYAHLASATGDAVPSFGYFVLLDQTLLGLRGGPFDQKAATGGPDPAQVWSWFSQAWSLRLQEVAAGQLNAPGTAIDRATVDGDRLALPAGCRYCAYDLLCGHGLTEPEGEG